MANQESLIKDIPGSDPTAVRLNPNTYTHTGVPPAPFLHITASGFAARGGSITTHRPGEAGSDDFFVDDDSSVRFEPPSRSLLRTVLLVPGELVNNPTQPFDRPEGMYAGFSFEDATEVDLTEVGLGEDGPLHQLWVGPWIERTPRQVRFSPSRESSPTNPAHIERLAGADEAQLTIGAIAAYMGADPDQARVIAQHALDFTS
jgi:hypothetical protein